MKKEEILDLLGELQSALELLEGGHDTLTDTVTRQAERIRHLEQQRPIIAPGTVLGKMVRDLAERVDGAETQLGNLILSDARQGDRIDAVENHRDRIATPLIHKLVERVSKLDDTLANSVGTLGDRVYGVEVAVADTTTWRPVDGHSFGVLSSRVAKLEQSPCDKAWAGRIQTQLDQLRTADTDLRSAWRRVSSRIDEEAQIRARLAQQVDPTVVKRVQALEDTYVKSANFADAMARLATLEDKLAWLDTGEARREFLNGLVEATPPQGYLVFELWRSAVPHPCGGKTAPEKMLERTIVAPGSLVMGPSARMQLDRYPDGYHWVVRDTEHNILAVAVNTGPPDPMKVKR